MLSCKQASQLISQSLDRRLTWNERVALRFHLMICDVCRRFSQQLELVLLAVRKLTRQIELDEQIQIPEDAKKRISKAIDTKRQ